MGCFSVISATDLSPEGTIYGDYKSGLERFIGSVIERSHRLKLRAGGDEDFFTGAIRSALNSQPPAIADKDGEV